jgi:hypothetical protein
VVKELEAPGGDPPDWDSIYIARPGDELAAYRPVMTGDVFNRVELYAADGTRKIRNVMVIQHPCAIRQGAIEIAESILVAVVDDHPFIEPSAWKGHSKLMPLPDFRRETQSRKRHQAAFFDRHYIAHRSQLSDRISALSLSGTNLLLQRWVRYSSGVVVPTYDLDGVVCPVYEEVEIVEEWCETALANGKRQEDAEIAVVAWLDETTGGVTRREALVSSQYRARIRREARSRVRSWIDE